MAMPAKTRSLTTVSSRGSQSTGPRDSGLDQMLAAARAMAVPKTSSTTSTPSRESSRAERIRRRLMPPPSTTSSTRAISSPPTSHRLRRGKRA